MTLTLELPADVQQVLEARAQALGLSLPKYFLVLAARDATELSRPGEWAQAAAPAVGSPAASLAHSARLRELLAAPAEERARVLAAEAHAYEAFCGTPEGHAEWEEMQPWLNTPGPDIEDIEAEDAAQERAA